MSTPRTIIEATKGDEYLVLEPGECADIATSGVIVHVENLGDCAVGHCDGAPVFLVGPEGESIRGLEITFDINS